MYNKRLTFFAKVANFFGVNAKDTPPNFQDGEWHEDSMVHQLIHPAKV